MHWARRFLPLPVSPVSRMGAENLLIRLASSNRAWVSGLIADDVVEVVPGHEAALVQLTAHLAVHIDQALAFLEGQHRTLDLTVHQNGGDVDDNALVVDVQQEGVGFFAPEQGVLQHGAVQVGQGVVDGAAQKGAGSLSQQAVADAVDPADDAGGVHLDDAVEGVVQQGVDLGGVVLFQIDGVAHPAGEVQRVVDALAAGGNVLVGQFFLPGGLADDIAADDADTAVGLRLGHRISQLLVLAHHVQLQLDPEKLVEPGSVAEHIGNADQTRSADREVPAQI